MAKDPIVEEVRRIRQQYAARFNYDVAAIFRDLQDRQGRGEFTVVSRKPRRPVVGVVPKAADGICPGQHLSLPRNERRVAVRLLRRALGPRWLRAW